MIDFYSASFSVQIEYEIRVKSARHTAGKPNSLPEKGVWSVRVTGNWRVTFQFDGPDAVAVDYRDYHK